MSKFIVDKCKAIRAQETEGSKQHNAKIQKLLTYPRPPVNNCKVMKVVKSIDTCLSFMIVPSLTDVWLYQ